MSTYYLYDGQNEVGPFSIDLLKQQKLTRHTPIRKNNTNTWMPADKLEGLKEVVAPKKIRKPKDIVPAVKEKIADLKERRPLLLYAILVAIGLAICITIYSVSINSLKELPKEVVQNNGPRILGTQTTAISATPLTEVTATEVKTTEEKAKLAAVKTDKEKAARQQWRKLISVTNSNYGIGFLGGIKDLNIIVTNRTDYPIDEAVAKVTYIKANGDVWKTKLVSVSHIAAHDSKEEPVTDVGRGKKVKVSIQKIVSKKMKFNYTEGQKTGNPEDPYVL